MLAQEQRVQAGQRHILIGSTLAGGKTLNGGVRVATRTVVGRGQIDLAVRTLARQELASLERAQVALASRIRAVHLSQVDVWTEQIELFTMTYIKIFLLSGLFRIFQIILFIPRRQSNDGKAADERVNCMHDIFMTTSFDGICTDMHDGLFELHPQLTIFPDESLDNNSN